LQSFAIVILTNAVFHFWPLKHKRWLIEHEWLNIEDKSKKHHFSALEAYKYNPINSAVENLLKNLLNKEYTELSMSNEHPPQQDEELDAGVEAEQQNAENAINEEFVELTEDQQRIIELEAAVTVAETKLLEQKDSVMRAIANADNARKRAQGEIDKARKFALEKFAGELLPVADNLERALQVANPEDEAIKPIVDGVEMTLKSFFSTIEKFGMTVIDPQGQPFNPEQHQAMSMQENAELPPNTVMAVMQKGYEINGRLLRPAMVLVTRAPEGKVDIQA
jgi:molecular chaperone GrpE